MLNAFAGAAEFIFEFRPDRGPDLAPALGDQHRRALIPHEVDVAVRDPLGIGQSHHNHVTDQSITNRSFYGGELRASGCSHAGDGRQAHNHNQCQHHSIFNSGWTIVFPKESDDTLHTSLHICLVQKRDGATLDHFHYRDTTA